jgi:4-aminobutyrate aminotransferase-like enzyme
MTTNAELAAFRAGNVPRGVPATAPVYVAGARNATITDVEGREYIDFAAGIGVMNVGHSHPKVVAAIKEQADLYSHMCFGLFGYESSSSWPNGSTLWPQETPPSAPSS